MCFLYKYLLFPVFLVFLSAQCCLVLVGVFVCLFGVVFNVFPVICLLGCWGICSFVVCLFVCLSIAFKFLMFLIIITSFFIALFTTEGRLKALPTLLPLVTGP